MSRASESTPPPPAPSQLVDFPIRKDKTLDIFLTTHQIFKQMCTPMPSIGNSDHDMSHVMRKPIYAICEQQRRRSACASIESYLVENPEDRFSRDEAHIISCSLIPQQQSEGQNNQEKDMNHLVTKPTVSVRPAKTQISLGIRPVWSESSLSAWRKLGLLATHWAHSEDWSDWVDAQADLSLRWAHSHIVGFVTRRLIFLWKRADIQGIKDDLSNLIDIIEGETDLNQAWSSLKNTIIDVMDKRVPSKMTTSRHTNHRRRDRSKPDMQLT